MITIIVFLLIGGASLMAAGWLYASNAPVGYEDKTGFHLAQPSYQVPDEAKSSISLIPCFRWSFGLATLFVGFLILFPQTNQNAIEPSSFTQAVKISDLKVENAGKTFAASTARAEHSRLVEGLCLRFTEIQ